MTPTLIGRLQSRIVLLAAIGIPWALLIAPLLPGSVSRSGAVAVLGAIAVLGLGWELAYHAGQQLRWDKDWPSAFSLAALVPEAAVAWPVLNMIGLAPASIAGYLVLFGSTWLLIWLVSQGPISVVAPRWRHSGGRLFALRSARPAPAAEPRHRRTSALPGLWVAGPVKLAATAAAAALVVGLLARDSAPPVSSAQELPPPTVEQVAEPPADAGPPAEAEPPVEPAPAAEQISWDTGERITPTAISVPRIDAESSLIGLGLKSDGRLQTPSVETPMQAGWYELGPAPGELGPAVVVGHIDGSNAPGIFYRLGELEPGDEIFVEREDGSALRFEVERLREVPKTEFPTDEVYGYVEQPQLRLISCTGWFDSSAGSYQNNIIVYATARSLEPATARR